MSELQLVIVHRPPSGRKRTGGGYIGRSKRWDGSPRRYRQRPTGKLSPRQQEIVTLLQGPDWKTVAEIAAATGMLERTVACRLSQIRHSGDPNLRLLGRWRPGPGSRKGWRMEYLMTDGFFSLPPPKPPPLPPARAPRLTGNAPSLVGKPLSERDRTLAEQLAGAGWKTVAEIQSTTGLPPRSLWAALTKIRHCGPPEFTVRIRKTTNPAAAGGRSEYRVEKG